MSTGRRRSSIALVAVLAVSASLLTQLPASVRVAPPYPSSPVARSSVDLARETARQIRREVEVSDLTTPASRTLAQPDGSWKVEASAAPVRVRDAQGRWQSMDLTLALRGDGTIVPVRSPVQLTMAGGDALITAGTGNHKVSMGSPGQSSRPELSGASATYPQVRPGVDLRLTATPMGFDLVVVIQDAAAAGQIADLRLPWQDGDLSTVVDQSGALELRDGQGALVGRISAPATWSSARVAPSAAAVFTLDEQAGRAALVLHPDQDFLRAPSTKYPVTISSSLLYGRPSDSSVFSASSTDVSGATRLWLGRDGRAASRGPVTSRSFLSWPTGPFRGTRIVSATLSLWQVGGVSCDRAAWQVWATDAASPPTRWDGQPTWLEAVSSATGRGGASGSCGTGWVQADVGPLVRRAAGSTAPWVTMGLRSADEGADGRLEFSSSRAGSNVPMLTVTYTTKPSVARPSPIAAVLDGVVAIDAVTPAVIEQYGTIVVTGTGFPTGPGQVTAAINGKAVYVLAVAPNRLDLWVGNATSGPLVITTPDGTAESATDVFIVPGPWNANDVESHQRLARDTDTTVAVGEGGKIALLTLPLPGGAPVGLSLSASLFGLPPAGAQVSVFDSAGHQVAGPSTVDPNGTFVGAFGTTAGSYLVVIDPQGDATGQLVLKQARIGP